MVTEAVALRATCDRGKSGAIIVKNGRIIAAGYVGSPAGTPHCDEEGHEMETRYDKIVEKMVESRHCIRTVHAEMNAILQAARYGPPIEGADIHCTLFPCYACAKAIANVGIRKVFAFHDYQRSERSKALFTSVGILWLIEDPKVLGYEIDSGKIS
jgi:dCMP deaminase